MDIVHEIKGGDQHKPFPPHRKVPEGWGKPPPPPPQPPAPQAAPQAPLLFTTQGLRGTLQAVRTSDGVLEVALPFGRGFMHPSSLQVGQRVAFAGGVGGVLEAVRSDGFLVCQLPFGRGFLSPASLVTAGRP
jgi:hypothetical protein